MEITRCDSLAAALAALPLFPRQVIILGYRLDATYQGTWLSLTEALCSASAERHAALYAWPAEIRQHPLRAAGGGWVEVGEIAAFSPDGWGDSVFRLFAQERRAL